MKTKINPWWMLPVALIAGILIGIFLFGNEPAEEHAHAEVAEITDYTCSMHPQIRQNEPGECPICGMNLVPLSEADISTGQDYVTLSASAIRLGNIRTIQVGLGGTSEKSITLNGRVVSNENLARTQTSHVSGRIERLNVSSLGEEVQKGQTIATLYSPKLIAAQQELLQAAEMSETQPGLLAAARQKLKSFRLTDELIDNIIASGEIRNNLNIHADYSGTVVNKKVNVGDHVQEGGALYVLSDLSKVWVEFDAYDSDLPFINIGDEVNFTVSGIPGKKYTGAINFINPVVDPGSRVTTVRVEIPNTSGKLKPDMFARGEIQTENVNTGNQLMVPRSAVLWTGERAIVYVKENAGEDNGASFRMQEIVLGPALGDNYVVENGLAPGAEIVANGTFTVDAASQLAGKPSMMNVQDQKGTSLEQIPPSGTPPALITDFTSRLIRNYAQLKDYLVASEFEMAHGQTNALHELFREDSGFEVNDEWDEWWTNIRNELQPAIDNAVEAKNIDELRRVFIKLSESMVELGQVASSMDVPVFIMRCPMANNNQGARWLSFEEEVRNPYYGDLMINCGSVTETIE